MSEDAQSADLQTCSEYGWNEGDRLAALERYSILDTGRETAFDDVARLAADLLDAPIAVVNFVASDRQWFKAEIGIGKDELPLDVSICRHAILQPGIFVVPDLSKDERFEKNPLVDAAGGLRFYAGAALETPEGLPLGTVCILDTKARPDGLSERQERALQALASQTMAQLELRRSEAALRESEERFRNMADNAPVMMWVTDKEGYCTYLNKGWYEFTGQSREEAEGLGWLDATHPDDAANAKEIFLQANAAQRPFRLEYRLRRADGTYRWAIDAASPRFAEDGTYLGYVGSVIDIDERRENEKRLALSEEQLRLALESGEIGQWDVDQATGAIFWPPRVKAMFGITTDVPVTLEDFYEGIHPEDRERTRRAYEAASNPELRALYDVEYRTVGKEDGVVRWVAAKGRGLFGPDGVCHRVIGTAIDITARKANEIRLRESEAELRALNTDLEHKVTERAMGRSRTWQLSPELIGVANLEGFFEQSNPAWEEVLGWSEAEVSTTPFFDFVHPDDHQRTEAAWLDLKERGIPALRFENRWRTKAGDWRWLSWVAVPDDGKVYCSARDVTAEKAQAAALAQAEEALRQSQKLEAMGQLTGGVAHDFNNLLTPIIGSLDMLQRKGVGDDRAKRQIDGALQSAERAKTLVQRLLAFARRQPLQSTAVDVSELVTGMRDLISSTIGPSIEVVVETGKECPPAYADANQLEMALLNLAVNARDAMPDGGRLTIGIDCETLPGDEAAGLSEGTYVLLRVSDTGSGMDEETQKRAIEPFFSTKGIGRGTGLGLSMVHGLAAQLGGNLSISSVVDQGTTIELRLPARAQPAEMEERVELLQPTTKRVGTALLVDDEILVRMGTADMLEDLGYKVVEASSGEDAIELLNDGLQPDIMLTDHLMPGMNGAELIRKVREDRPGLPMVIISGYSEVQGIPSNISRLSKPFRAIELEECLAKMTV